MVWIVEARNTLLVGDGRPISAGAQSDCLPMPWPSTVAGMVRTRAGSNADGFFSLTPEEARQIAVRGPWVHELADEGGEGEAFFPAPRDCVWYPLDSEQPTGARRRVGLRPLELAEGERSDHAGTLLAEPYGTPQKPARGPFFWSWTELQRWLLSPVDERAAGAESFPTDWGLKAFDTERRMHVSIAAETQTAADGFLFATTALRMQRRVDGGVRRYGIGFACEDTRLNGREGVLCLGGDRRASFLRSSAFSLPGIPAGLQAELEAAGQARVVLLSPAIWQNGAVPAAIGQAPVFAAAVDRPQVVSGWDWALRRPKPSRRMAPAGSVYWVSLAGLEVRDWLATVWFQCMSDAEQDRRDGFGMLAVGVA